MRMCNIDGNGYFLGTVDLLTVVESPTLLAVDPPTPGMFVRPKWDATAGTWVEGATEVELLDAAKAAKRDELEMAFNQAVSQLVSGYSEFERATWPQQEREAREVVAAQATGAALPPTPMLTAIATARGITVEDLAAVVAAKADAFAEAIGALLGKKQSLQAQVDAAAAVAEVESIAW